MKNYSNVTECWECFGTGKIEELCSTCEGFSFSIYENKKEVCPTCKGKGLVLAFCNCPIGNQLKPKKEKEN